MRLYIVQGVLVEVPRKGHSRTLHRCPPLQGTSPPHNLYTWYSTCFHLPMKTSLPDTAHSRARECFLRFQQIFLVCTTYSCLFCCCRHLENMSHADTAYSTMTVTMSLNPDTCPRRMLRTCGTPELIAPDPCRPESTVNSEEMLAHMHRRCQVGATVGKTHPDHLSAAAQNRMKYVEEILVG